MFRSDQKFSKAVTPVTWKIDHGLNEATALGETMSECLFGAVWLGIIKKRHKPGRELPNLKAEMKGNWEI